VLSGTPEQGKAGAPAGWFRSRFSHFDFGAAIDSRK